MWFDSLGRMSLRNKVFLVVLLSGGILSVLLVSGAHFFLASLAQEQESSALLAGVSQTKSWFETKSDMRMTMVKDWSFWDAAWDHFGKPSEEFRKQNIDPVSLAKTGTNLLLMIDTNGGMLEQVCQDSSGEKQPCPERFVQSIQALIPSWNRVTEFAGHGVVYANQDYYAMGASQVLPHTHPGVRRGYLVMGERLQPKNVPPPGGFGVAELLPLSSLGVRDTSMTLTYLKSDSVDAMLQLPRVATLEGAQIWARVPRTAYLQGLQSIRYWTGGMLLITILVSSIMFLFLNLSVVRRLTRLRTDLEKVGLEGGLDRRVGTQGKDDIGILADQVNKTLAALETAQAEQIEIGLTDSVTGLPNRKHFIARFDAAMKIMPPDQIALLIVNLDRFQRINDTMGWALGDQVLREVTRRLQGLEGCAFLSRVGGDEFAILVEGATEQESLMQLARRIELLFDNSIRFSDGHPETAISVRVGVSTGKDFPGAGHEEAVRSAEVALHKAQLEHGSRVAFFNREMDQRVHARMELERELLHAYRESEFQVAFQPIVSLQHPDSPLAGFEALVRWRHPTRGLVSPAEFIPIAEDTGLIVEIGDWVLRESCRQLAAWHQSHTALDDVFISVNLSVRQFRDPQLVDRVKHALLFSGIPAHLLKLEITESAMMDDPDDFKNRLAQLRELGTHLSLDDFGTGYSSLKYLDEFPVQTLKVDKSFVDRLLTTQNPHIVNTVVTMAHNMQLNVVAEGIEQAEQADALREMGCEYGQGYLFSKPRFPDDLAKYLDAESRGRVASLL